MKKLLVLFLTLMFVWSSISFAGIASTYKYQLSIVDENGQPVTYDAKEGTLYVKTVDTNTNASLWPTPDTSTGTMTGAVAPDANGKIEFFAVAASYDIHFQFRGKSYIYEDVTPGSDHRLTVEKNLRPILLDTEALKQKTTDASAFDVPLSGSFFLIRPSASVGVRELSEVGGVLGRRISLLFQGTGPFPIAAPSSGTNILLTGVAGTINVGPGTVLDFVYDGTNWVGFSPKT